MIKKWRTSRIFLSILLLTIVVIFAGWLIVKSESDDYSLNGGVKQMEMVTTLVKKPETRYFGYYSIDLPADFSRTGMSMFIQGSEMTKVETRLQYYPPFQQLMKRYQEELQNHGVDNSEDAPYLKNVYSLMPSMKGIIFERNKDQHTPDAARVLDAWKWEDGVTFTVDIEVRDGRSARYDEYRDTAKFSYGYDIPEKKKQLLLILSELQPRKDNQAPNSQKLAFQYGQIEEFLLGTYEVVENYKNSNGIMVNLSTDNNNYVGNLLLDTDKNVMETTNGTTLFKKRKNNNGLEISEWGIRRDNFNGGGVKLDYEFNLVIHQDKKNSTRPLELIMRYSSDLTNTDGLLTENELIALWQNITSSIKYYK